MQNDDKGGDGLAGSKRPRDDRVAENVKVRESMPHLVGPQSSRSVGSTLFIEYSILLRRRSQASPALQQHLEGPSMARMSHLRRLWAVKSQSAPRMSQSIQPQRD